MKIPKRAAAPAALTAAKRGGPPKPRSKNSRLLQAGVLGAAGMREARGGVGGAVRRARVGVGATGGPPAIRVFFGLAHLDAAAAHFGLRAAAIAAACGDGAQKGRRVGKKRECAGEQTDCRGEHPDRGAAAQKCSNAKSSHAPFCASLL